MGLFHAAHVDLLTSPVSTGLLVSTSASSHAYLEETKGTRRKIFWQARLYTIDFVQHRTREETFTDVCTILKFSN